MMVTVLSPTVMVCLAPVVRVRGRGSVGVGLESEMGLGLGLDLGLGSGSGLGLGDGLLCTGGAQEGQRRVEHLLVCTAS